MAKYRLNGTRGFIGSALLTKLDSAERVMTGGDNGSEEGAADMFVNLANIATNARENLTLLKRNVASYGSSVRHWVQIQSFVTLHGDGTPDSNRYNFGFRPRLGDQYVMGKLAQERYLLDALLAGRIKGLTLIYLPAMLDEGGAWDGTIKRARAHGYVLPNMAAESRCNFAFIDDLAATLSHIDPSVTCQRILLNRPEAASTRWADVLGPTHLSYRDLGIKHAIKSNLRVAFAHVKAKRVAGRGVPVAADIANFALPDPMAIDNSVAPSQTPVEFFGVTRHLIAHQPFITNRAA